MLKNRIIYSRKIMLQLVKMGVYPVETIKNPFQPQYWCWVFEDTPELEKKLDLIFGAKGD